MLGERTVMEKNDQVIEQLEKVLKELKAGKEQTAATATLKPQRKVPQLSGALFKFICKFWGFKIILNVLLLVIVVSGMIWLFLGNASKKESVLFVEQVQELATLATAEAHVKVVIEQEDNKLFGKDIGVDLPGTKREVLLIVPATVMAGVDLKQVTSDDIKVDEKEKRLEIVLPPAEFLQDPSIQMDKVSTYSDEGLFRDDVKWDEGFDLTAEAQKKIKLEANDIGLLETAEDSAEKVLKEFFGHLGYSVEVSIK